MISHKKPGKSFSYGTREFIVTRQGGKLLAKDVHQELDNRFT